MEKQSKTRAQQIYYEFLNKVGSNEIASIKALKGIEKNYRMFLEKFPSVQVIEIGAGIGTISSLLYSISDSPKILLYEKNDWCIAQLKNNLEIFGSDKPRIFSNIEELITEIDKSLPTMLILDDYITDLETQDLISVCNLQICIIEGHRFRQRLATAKALKSNRREFSIRFFGNSKESVKGYALFIVLKTNIVSKIICMISSLRLTLQSTKIARKIMQFVGIRVRKIRQIF